MFFRYVFFIFAVLTLKLTQATDAERNTDEDPDASPVQINSDPKFNPPTFSEKVTEPSNIPKKNHDHPRPHGRPDFEYPQPPRSPLFEGAYQPGYGYDGPYGIYGPEEGYYDRPWGRRHHGRIGKYPGYGPGQRGGRYPSQWNDAAGYGGGGGYGQSAYWPSYPDYGYGSRAYPPYGGGYGYGPSQGFSILSGLLS